MLRIERLKIEGGMKNGDAMKEKKEDGKDANDEHKTRKIPVLAVEVAAVADKDRAVKELEMSMIDP